LHNIGGLEKIKKLKKITKNTLIIEIVLNYPELAQELAEIGFHCIGCPASSFETIKDGCIVHGLSEEEIEKFIKKLNEKIKIINSSSKQKKGE
jgi:hybrid cluster-associated redox disulfide protein